MTGRLIAMCGIDGCGKTTQLQLLSAWLAENGIDVFATKQPTDFYRQTPWVRSYIDNGRNPAGMRALALLAAADRQMHLETVIEPALARGHWVICDRYVYSSYAFFSARGVQMDFVRTINQDVRQPDLTIFLDVAPATARERVLARDGPKLKHEERSLAFMEVVRQGFYACADQSFYTLDATESADELHQKIRVEVKRQLFNVMERSSA